MDSQWRTALPEAGMRLAGRSPRAQRGVDTAGPLRLDRVDKRDRQRNRAY